MHLLDPAGAPPAYRLWSCRATFDEVTRTNGTTVLHGATVTRDVRRRVLVLGQPASMHLDHLVRLGVEVRTTSAVLPVLLLIDGERARIEVSADGRAGRTAWTHDPAQVAALHQLFELWWGGAQSISG